MATKPLTTEAIALTEKKMDMSLDDIIKMSKTKVGKSKNQRVSNKGHRINNGNQDRSSKVRQYMDSRFTVRQGVLAQRRTSFQGNSFPLAAEAAQKAAVTPFRNRPLNHNRAFNWNRQRPGGTLRLQGNASNGGNALKKQQHQKQNQNHNHQQLPLPREDITQNQRPKTLDSLFANMKEQRMRASTQMSNGGPARGGTFTHVSNGGHARGDAFTHTNNRGPARGGAFTHTNNRGPARGGAFTHTSNRGPARGGGGSMNQPRQPWLRGRFGSYRN